MPILTEVAYFPSIGYMAEVMHADAVVLEVFETYQKQSCRNHCCIYGPNGKQVLSIPVNKVNGNRTLTKDIRISDHQPWQIIHWRSIETAYNNSPFFLYYRDYFARFYENNFRFLVDLNMDILETLLKILKIECPVRKTEKFEKSPGNVTDLRGIHGTKSPAIHTAYPHYTQVFEPRYGFIPGLSVLDALFNLGPEASSYIGCIK